MIKRGASEDNIITFNSKELDLRIWKNCQKSVKNIDIVIHLAAKVGGIGYNQDNPGTLFYENALMGIQMIEAARLENVEKFVSIGTVCAYPKYTETPFKERDLWEGYPEETNAPYGIAKKILSVQSSAYRQQYGFNSIFLLPANLYGPGDNFDLEKSHVIPALIRKFHEAKLNQIGKTVLWGTGNSTREFLYVRDAAEGIVLATEKYNKSDPINLGSGNEIFIKDLAEIISKILAYKGVIVWDNTKPDGQPRRKLDISKAKEEFGFEAKTPLEQGIKETISWYNNYK